MKKMECLKRILSLVLALSIMLSCVPVQVFALETEPQSVPETTAPTETTAPAETDPTETTAPADTQPPETTIPADTQPPATTEPIPTETTEVTEPSVPETTMAVEPAFSTMIMMADASRSTEIVESLWNGKSAVFVGDSITAGSGTDEIYYQYLNETLGFSSVTAMGVAGSCISAASDYGQSNQPLISRYQDIPAADLIVIFMGTNDYGHETPLGSIEDTQDGTFYGALNTMIPALTAKHSSGKLVFVTPMHRYGFGTSKILGTQFTSDNIPNGVGAALGDYVEALKTVCGKHGVSVIDLYTECTLDPADPEVRTNYMPDGLHPNAAGHELIAGIMASHIRGYSPVENAPGTEPDEETELVYGNRFADGFDQQNRASSRINQYLKAGTVITLKDPATFQWACVKTSNENSSNNLGYFPDSAWTDKESAVVEADGWIGFVFKYRDESQLFDLTQPLSDYITIEEPHTHSYEAKVTAPTCTEQGYTTYTCDCSDSYVGDYVDAKGHSYKNGICTICGEKAPDLAGKTISILGASISTFAGTSNGAGADTSNSTIRNNVKYYPNTTIPEVGLNDTWWMQVAEDLGLRLLVNNAWSGSAILLERSGTVGAYVDRCVQLHDDTGDNAGEAPDIICIQMGFNDFSYGKDTLGAAADIKYDTLITADGYGTPSTTMEATAIMLDKITKRYPDAEVYMFNHFKRIGQSAADTTLMEGLNGSIETVCARYGVKVVDLYTTLTDPAHIGDGRLHPNKLGMDVISEAVKTAIIGNTEYQVTTHTAKLALDGVTADYGTDKILVDGTGFAVKLTAPAGDTLSVTVTMGGEDITNAVYANGTVSIEAVNGDVVITAQAVHTPKDYRWEFNGTDLACVSGDNALTKKAGTTTEGVFSTTRYALAAPVVLNHDQPWVVEWKSEGTFQNANGSSGARVFTSDDVNANYNARYIFKSNTNGIVAMGEKTTTGSHNYGIALKDHGIDWTALHTYRLENRIANDGSNMVYLWVDGAEIGPMTHYYVGTTDKKTTSDWLSGKDFVLPYMGTDTHGFTNCSIDYIQVWEGGKPEQALAGKVISILGGSTCTFDGYIPVADGFNLTHRARYPQANLLTDVNETWWMQLITQLDAKLGINDSWAGSTVSNFQDANSGDLGPDAAMASLTRIRNLGSNGTPDVILFYGAMNDIGQAVTLGSFDPVTAPSQVDLTATKWDSLADAYVAAIMRMQHYYPDALIVSLLPGPTASYYTEAELETYGAVLKAICDHYGVSTIDLRESGLTTADLPDGTHPDAEGMDLITDYILENLLVHSEIEAGENVVYSVTHELENAEASLSFYKGVSAGKAFEETLTGENLAVTVTMGGKDVTSNCYSGNKVRISEVTGDIVVTAKAKFSLGDRLQQLPEKLCAGTNLWEALTPVNEYYTSSGWGNNSNSNYSVTFPVTAGEKIWATSFGAAGENGYTASGVRITWFSEDGVLESLAREKVYAEFAAKGYITAPDGASALNVPMISDSDDWEIYLLDREHTYGNGTCTICGETSDHKGKVISILGDSISTFAGYIPVADGFNLEHLARYPQDNLVTDVNETWWMQIIDQLDAKLGINDSWRGATVSGAAAVTSGTTGANAAMANLTRIQNLGSNGTPDVILFYGGTNDLAHVSKVGSFDPATAPGQVDLTTASWDNLADGYVHTLLRLKHYYPDAIIVAMLPTYTASYYSDTKLAQANELLAKICEHYSVPYVDLRDSGVTAEYLPDGIHPGAEGMDMITDAVLEVLAACETEAGEHTVHPVSHTLTNVKASLGHYKGIDAGAAFRETLSADGELLVTVTMNGQDITDTCYSDGVISIDAVSGALAITAKAKFSLEGHWQALPESYHGKNLWPLLDHDAMYYTVDGWAEHASGKVRSVTVSVTPGEKIVASSFAAAGTNGSSVDGIRVTFFSDDGVLVSMSADAVHKEFAENGYLTVPENATAVCIPMWTPADTWELYIHEGAWDNSKPEELSLRYDDHYDISGKTVEIVEAGTPTSYQVGYGVEENAVPDAAVVALEGDYLVATGIGTAKVKIDGTVYEITVTAAPISLLLLAGQSNMQGIDGNAAQSVVCPTGQVYATYADRYQKTVEDVTKFAPSALSGQYSSINVTGDAACLENYPVYMLTEAGNGREGMDSGLAYEWVQQTGEKIWVINLGYGGSSINGWLSGGAHFEACRQLLQACQETLRKEIAAGHYTMSNMGYFWCQGCADETQTAQWYVEKFQTMHQLFKTEFAFDHDSAATTPKKTMEFSGIIPIRSGHAGRDSYRAGIYMDTTSVPYYQSFKDLRFNGPRVAQYWMGNNPELTDIWNVCTIQEEWATLPDGTDGVQAYFRSAYENGTVDYPVQVKQAASWYTPKTPADVHDNIHYNQIGYNELGRESARNALILLGRMEAPDAKAAVEFLSWDGFTPVQEITASPVGNSGTLAVPVVSPVWKSKEVTYQASEGVRYDYYDLLADSSLTTGTLSAVGAEGTVTIAPQELTSYLWTFDGNNLVSSTEDGFTENPLKRLNGSVSNGQFNNMRYQAEQSILLLHDKEWGLEIQIDNWTGTTGSMILSSGQDSTSGQPYLYFRPTDFFVGFGYYDGSLYHNYGVSLKKHGIACAEGAHTYRFVNRISEDGSNQIWLYVDSQEIGPLSEHYTNSTLKDTDNTWINGRDFTLPYFGTNDMPLRGCVVNSVRVHEVEYDMDAHIHRWSAWETVTNPGPEGPGTEIRTCAGCGEKDSREIEGVWQTHDLGAHLVKLPDTYCAGTNLWNVLAHDKYYYHSGTHWGIHDSGTVYSVTIPVSGGEQIYATSFGAYGTNGNTIGTGNGIRVTFFDAVGVAKNMAPGDTYAEFSANGYLTVPEDAVAVNVPMYGNGAENELYILNAEHRYSGGICTICGEKLTFEGKTVSILGHSMSTYAGVSNNTAYNSTIGSNDVYYTEGKLGVYREDTWWQQAIDALGMELLVNNSWSGSCVFQPRKGEASVGYGDRAVNLHNDHTGEEPDIIWVYIGCNDFAYYKDTFGTGDAVDYSSLIQENGDGTFTYAAPRTACEAYAIMLHKVETRYPDAEVYCITSTARRDPDYTGDSYPDAGQPTAYMAELHKVAKHFACPVVDLEDCIPKEADQFDQYIGDKCAHANALGMDKITCEVLSVMLDEKAEICHVTCENGAVKEQAVLLGGSYSAEVALQEGYSLTVTMGGEDVTEKVYQDGKITIDEVTGDIAVYAVINREPMNFGWALKDGELVSIGETENSLRKIAGTVTDGLLNDGRFELTTSVMLKHDLPWEVEWKCAENWRGVLLSTAQNAKTEGMTYLSRVNGGQLCFGTWTGTQYDNYGIDISYLDDQSHTYRLLNRPAADGSNMVWLYVDGVEIGPMDQYYIGSNDQNKTADWISGQDFVLHYIGMEGHALRNCRLDYLRIRESGHTHDYASAVTEPTCTEQGYTTHTCTVCGDSYVDSYTDPRPLNILMIGNSFSWDAADFWYDMQESMTYDAMKSMLAEPYDIHFAVMYKGSATLAYHATCAMKDTRNYTYTEIGSETNYVWTPSGGQNATNGILEHLEERDWDIIVIQSYQHEADGTEPRSTYTGGDAQFEKPDASLGYLLDYFDEHEPGAQIYYYMPWATTKFYEASGVEAGYKAIAKCSKDHILHMTGTDSGRKLAGIIPVGTGIQNARTTYLDELCYSSGSGSTALLQDPQIGLQYDNQHLSFGIGRYIAGIIVAESLIPQEMRKDSYSQPGIKDSPSVGSMPVEYTQIAQKAAAAAMEQPYAVTVLPGYEKDLADRVCDAIETADYSAEGIADETALRNYVEAVVAEKLKDMGSAESAVTIHSFELKDGKIAAMEASVTLRIGYTGSTAEISVTDGKAHRFGDWECISVPSAAGPGLERRTCETCGFVDERAVEGSWQKYALADHLQELTEKFCSETNLWSLLEPETVMIDHLGNWVSAGTTVYSVTIPITPGEKIYANSFDQTDTRKGIQVSFIGDYGIVKTTFSSGTYEEFHANGGYLIAPEGAIAVNIPVWNVNDADNTIHILGYDHVYESMITVPTCTEKGYTTHTCTGCGDSYVDNEIAAFGHTEVTDQAVEATCTTTGLTEGKRCSVCETILVKQEVIPAKGHTEVIDKAVAATCTETGLTEGKHCSVCSEVLVKQEVVAAKGHTEAIDKAVDATCTETGLTEGKHCSVCESVLVKQEVVPAKGHSWNAGEVTKEPTEETDGERVFTCTTCGEIRTEIIPSLNHVHTYEPMVTAPTCTEKGYTTHTCRCGDSYVDSYVEATGHSYGEWMATTAPTCTEKGTERRDCAKCDAYETRDIAATGHVEVIDEATDATCTETGLTEGKHCSVCDEILVKQEVVAAKGHTEVIDKAVEATCTETGLTEGKHCSVCETILVKQEVVVAKGHTEVIDKAVAATCTESGLTEGKHCSVCSVVLVRQETVPAKGHTAVIDKTVAATCTETGLTEGKHCSVCDTVLVKQNVIPAKGHVWNGSVCSSCGQMQGYRIDLDPAALGAEDSVWIDGVEYPAAQDGRGWFTMLDHTNATNLVIYTYNDPYAQDVHTQYPTGMKVWTLHFENGAYTAQYIPGFDNLLQYSGSSIRIVGVKGIRMITSIEKSKRDALTGAGLDGYTLVEYGTAVAWTSDLAGGEGLLLGKPYTKSNFAYKRGVADPIFNDTGDLLQYTNVLVGFSDDQCIPDLAMRPYIILEDADGRQITIYGGTVCRSIGYIAWQNRTVFPVGSAAYEYVWGIIHHVYGDRFDADYKG